MRVSQRMTPNPITVSLTTTHRDAADLMRRHHIRRLPVVDHERRLLGIVTQTDILNTSPSPATTLSIYEIYTLLDQLKVEQFMTSPAFAVDEDCAIADAAQFMIQNTIGALPVVKDDRIVGIITETDIFRTFVEILGGGEVGASFDVRAEHKKGTLAAVAKATADAGGNIVSLTTFHAADPEHAVISVKERGADVPLLKRALESIDHIEILEFSETSGSRLLTIGKTASMA